MTTASRKAHWRREEGFGLIELLIAMTMLTVALLALFAAYSSSYVALRRATRVSSAAELADSQMERFSLLVGRAAHAEPDAGQPLRGLRTLRACPAQVS